ncbi:MAG: hypothetical protein O7A08_15100 [SAR324 cluster bacterium]|nr:hypothetical protein [SAR324 cluster bacterium]MCZ6534276.1 hypothetical protein [SAR324 cluster bacterium]MCZ6559030.1 hypothetical protein [SAR324 cluster bacterium]MCZ6628785.1 hypothetical protein [SAR324 cluster bacterium]MCZ6644797.1 hypothetical protein [SAR324 cluster bacterium]
MRFALSAVMAMAAASLLMGGGAYGKEIQPMFGGWMTAGYDWGKKPLGPKGTISYDKKSNTFKGSYTGLAMPAGRRAIFAWLHDTVNQTTRYLGPVGWLKKTTGGQDKGRFTLKVPSRYKGGNFGSFEVIAFSAEKTSYLKGTQVVKKPAQPSGNKAQNPAFYLFAALPGADTVQIYCGHGQDFSFAKAPSKQRCYD